VAERASGVKMGDEGGWLQISQAGVVPTWIVGASASDISQVQKISSGTGSPG